MGDTIKGIRRTWRGWRAYGRVMGQFFGKSFPKDTALKVMKDWRQAERVRLRARFLAGELALAPRGTLAGDIEQYLAMIKSMPGLDQREYELKCWTTALGGDRPRQNITAPQLLAVMHDWRSQGLSPATCNRRRTALLHLWNRLDGKSARNPVRDVAAFNEGKPEARGRSYSVIDQIFAEMDPTKTRARLKAIAYIGLRHSEVKKLQPDDWNQAAATLLVKGTHKGAGTPVRLVKLTTKGTEAIKEIARQDAWGWFSNSSLHARWQAAIARANKRAAKDAAKRRRPAPEPIGPMRVYDLRHSMASELYRLMRDLKVVKEYLGHTSLSTTERYMHAAVSDGINAAAAAFDAAHPKSAKVLPMKARKRA